ncbi:MAG: response regulator [Planctomycetota bacterium]|jgi:two-component system chemotaxis response regulator CheY
MKVLIADDSSTARMFTHRCLEIAGLEDAVYTEVENGAEALECMKKDLPDLLVSDLTMPVMDGVELIRRVSASPKLCTVPIIVITSADNPAREAELQALGVGKLLPKPVNPAVVMEALQELGLVEDEG